MNEMMRKWMDRADLPGEPIPGSPLVELSGDNRVLIENHRGVMEYSPNRIGIRVRYGQVRICGYALELSHMTRDRLVISGRIDSIILCRRNDP